VFAQIVLADEINRATPKTQSALLEAMQERSVTVQGTTHRLPKPFFVMATQNPLEQEGTYPLPEAQLDRFFFKLQVGYAKRADMHEILEAHDRQASRPVVEPVLDAEKLLAHQRLVRMVEAAPPSSTTPCAASSRPTPRAPIPTAVRDPPCQPVRPRRREPPRRPGDHDRRQGRRPARRPRVHLDRGREEAVALPALRHRSS
jgi:hypothetical protein